MRPKTRILSPLALLLTAALTTAAFAQNAATFAPADAAVFIEINDLAALRKDWASDPLAKFLQKNLPIPADPGFAEVQKVMGMSGEEIVDRFFGQSVALVIFKPGDQDPGMLISKVADADAAIAIEKLQLKPGGTFGPGDKYRAFTSPDDKAHIAVGGGWVVVSQPKYSTAAKTVLEGAGKSLAEDAGFKAWTAKLPAGERVATVYVHPAADQSHALGVYRRGRDLTVQYRGKSPELAELISQTGEGKAMELGPLPASTIAAMSVNFRPMEGADHKQLNRFFPGKSFDRDILPKLAAPTVIFLGEVPGDRLTPDPGLAVPVGGFALKLKDSKAADDLTQAINGLLIVANFAAAKWELPPIDVKERQHAGTTFRSANVGDALAQRAGRDEVKALTLSYGRVGDWYVVCTQDVFFTQCIDAAASPSQSLMASKAVAAMPLKEREAPIATALLRPAALSAHVETWLAHWKEVRPQVVSASEQTEPATAEAQFVRAARIAAGLLDHYQSMSLQVYKDGDGVAAQADIVRK